VGGDHRRHRTSGSWKSWGHAREKIASLYVGRRDGERVLYRRAHIGDRERTIPGA
jgi:hypothetical protein